MGFSFFDGSLLSAKLGQLKTPIALRLIELVLFVLLLYVVGWVGDHSGQGIKFAMMALTLPLVFAGLALFINLISAIRDSVK